MDFGLGTAVQSSSTFHILDSVASTGLIVLLLGGVGIIIVLIWYFWPCMSWNPINTFGCMAGGAVKKVSTAADSIGQQSQTSLVEMVGGKSAASTWDRAHDKCEKVDHWYYGPVGIYCKGYYSLFGTLDADQGVQKKVDDTKLLDMFNKGMDKARAHAEELARGKGVTFPDKWKK